MPRSEGHWVKTWICSNKKKTESWVSYFIFIIIIFFKIFSFSEIQDSHNGAMMIKTYSSNWNWKIDFQPTVTALTLNRGHVNRSDNVFQTLVFNHFGMYLAVQIKSHISFFPDLYLNTKYHEGRWTLTNNRTFLIVWNWHLLCVRMWYKHCVYVSKRDNLGHLRNVQQD